MTKGQVLRSDIKALKAAAIGYSAVMVNMRDKGWLHMDDAFGVIKREAERIQGEMASMEGNIQLASEWKSAMRIVDMM